MLFSAAKDVIEEGRDPLKNDVSHPVLVISVEQSLEHVSPSLPAN